MRLRLPGHRLTLLAGLLLLLNAAGWAWLAALRAPYPFIVPLGALAYVFGLRHALDADHIAAIDNTTRKLMHDGQRPTGVGFFFSLGHSLMVAAMAGGLALATRLVWARLPELTQLGSLLGTTVSAAFMYLVGGVNLVVLAGVCDVFRQTRRGDVDPQRLEELLLQRGLMNRFVGRLYRTIRRSWQMLPVGLLFGLGFDTASEVALLGMASLAAGRAMPAVHILVLPLLFAAGMSLLDTADGVLMLYAYDWAFRNPLRKVFYNLTVTTMSVLVALLIGTIELLQVAAQEFALAGPFWRAVRRLDFGGMGYIIVGVLALTWAVAAATYRFKGYGRAVG